MKKLALLVLLAPALVHADNPKPAPATAAKPVTPPAAMPPVPPPPPAPPTPSADFNELAGGIVGTWKCTGKATTPAGEIAATSTIVNKLDLDKWWVQTTFTGKMGKATYKFTGFTGYSTPESKFYRFMVDNMGGSESNTAASIDHGMAGKWAIHWEGETRLSDKMGMPSNVMKSRHTEAYSKSGLEMSGEMSMDGGKTWVPAYTATCKK